MGQRKDLEWPEKSLSALAGYIATQKSVLQQQQHNGSVTARDLNDKGSEKVHTTFRFLLHCLSAPQLVMVRRSRHCSVFLSPSCCLNRLSFLSLRLCTLCTACKLHTILHAVVLPFDTKLGEKLKYRRPNCSMHIISCVTANWWPRYCKAKSVLPKQVGIDATRELSGKLCNAEQIYVYAASFDLHMELLVMLQTISIAQLPYSHCKLWVVDVSHTEGFAQSIFRKKNLR